ncbi:hypothetical protein [Nocardioides rubriscoriae]|uniref:hypothetical protein n=1 Tax=Nocardioides rubriscoriae TaxID=642762 RepID=UPI0011DFF0F0|nr:hypothetical protein [Nocardioides rubriscoriae]
MPIDPVLIQALRDALAAAEQLEADEALPHLREAADRLAELIDAQLAEAVVHRRASLRSAGAKAGLSENAVGPRLARTPALAPYANDEGRVTAAAVERARYDAETGAPPPAAKPAAPMRFKARRPSPPKGS